jgi:hypothetical protein
VEALLVALISTIGVVLAALIQKGRKENIEDHGYVLESLDRIEEKIDNHVDAHAQGKFIK